MRKDRFRLYKAILGTVFVAGMLVIAHRFVEKFAENGRYQQVDNLKHGEALGFPVFFDTRTGERE